MASCMSFLRLWRRSAQVDTITTMITTTTPTRAKTKPDNALFCKKPLGVGEADAVVTLAVLVIIFVTVEWALTTVGLGDSVSTLEEDELDSVEDGATVDDEITELRLPSPEDGRDAETETESVGVGFKTLEIPPPRPDVIWPRPEVIPPKISLGPGRRVMSCGAIVWPLKSVKE
jgi:hypothetical protein